MALAATGPGQGSKKIQSGIVLTVLAGATGLAEPSVKIGALIGLLPLALLGRGQADGLGQVIPGAGKALAAKLYKAQPSQGLRVLAFSGQGLAEGFSASPSLPASRAL